MITLSDRAVKEIKNIIAEMKQPQFLRVAVKGGGCSGFNYSLNLDDTTKEKDILEEQDGIQIVIDSRSAIYLEGVNIDFHEDLSKRGFVFNNPTSKSTCGCGKSFTV